MNHETPDKSLEQHTDEALAVVADDSVRPEAVVLPFPERRGQDSPTLNGEPIFEKQEPSGYTFTPTPDVRRRPERGLPVAPLLLGLGAVAATALFALPRPGGEAPASPERYTESAQNQADVPLSADDTVLIDNIKVKAGNPKADTASEAVLGDPRVKAYVDSHPDQSSAITASALSLPYTGGEYAIVERDIDDDGDGDAVAVPIETKN